MLHSYHLKLIEHLTFFSQIKVWCFYLQLACVLLLRQSEAWCLWHIQLKHNFFFWEDQPAFTNSHPLDLWPGFLLQAQTYAGFLSLSLTWNKFSLLRFSQDFQQFWGSSLSILKNLLTGRNPILASYHLI